MYSPGQYSALRRIKVNQICDTAESGCVGPEKRNGWDDFIGNTGAQKLTFHCWDKTVKMDIFQSTAHPVKHACVFTDCLVRGCCTYSYWIVDNNNNLITR